MMRAEKGRSRVDLPPTSWSLLGLAAGNGPGSAGALDTFVHRYYEPVFEYLAALSGSPEGARDLTQSFFTSRILEGSILARGNGSLGSFRCYLKRAVRNFYVDTVRNDRRLKRGGDAAMVPVEFVEHLADPAVDSEPARSFHSAWIRSLLREALLRVGDECNAHGQGSHLEIFAARYLSDADPVLSWAQLGEAHGVDEKAARGRAETVARRFRRVLRDMLRVELGSAHAVDEELLVMQALLCGGDP